MINSAGNFQTNDTALANTLALCGVPAPKDERGQPIPQIMLYDAVMLRNLGYKDMTADEAAQKAMKDRKAGVRVFQFVPSPLLDRIVKAHKQAIAWLDEGGDIHLPETEAEAVASIVLSANQMRRKMLSAWNIPALFVSTESGGKEYSEWGKGYRSVCAAAGGTPADTGYTSSGTLSAISVGASEQLKSEVRL